MLRRLNRLLHPFSWLEQKALFYPERSFRGDPGHVGLEFDDIFPVAADGVKLHGWHMPARSENARTSGVVWLIFHGNGGNISVRLDQYKELHRRYGAPVIAIDYRGYGKSEGEPSERGFYADALATYEFARKLYTDRKIVVFGRSMGGAVAAQLASVVAPAALVLEASISSMREIIRERAPWTWYSPIRFMVRSSFDTARSVAGTTTPVLLFHGDSDQTVSYQNSERIFGAAAEPKQLEIIPDGDHDGLDLVDPDRYHATLTEFLRTHEAL
jgi:fermentation-respiration switch protein FrsA (DUF1100 family)